ncbi:MAG: hypothetical protein K6347_06075 [Campylobacterales bacterium]
MIILLLTLALEAKPMTIKEMTEWVQANHPLTEGGATTIRGFEAPRSIGAWLA